MQEPGCGARGRRQRCREQGAGHTVKGARCRNQSGVHWLGGRVLQSDSYFVIVGGVLFPSHSQNNQLAYSHENICSVLFMSNVSRGAHDHSVGETIHHDTDGDNPL